MNLTPCQQVYLYISEEQYQKATELLEQNLNQHPEMLINYGYLGLIKLLQGQDLEAQEIWFSILLEKDQEEVDDFLINLTAILSLEAENQFHKQHFDLAQSLYNQIIELNPDQVQSYYKLGLVLAQLGNFDQALEVWQQAVEIEPNFQDVYQEIGKVQQKLAFYPEAVCAYNKALKIEPNCLENLYNLGICLVKQNQLNEAISCFNQCLTIAPEYPLALSELADLYLQQGQLENSLNCWQNFIKNQSDFFNYYCQWVEDINSRNQLNQKLNNNASFLQVFLSSDQQDQLFLALGKFLDQNSLFSQAKLCYQKAIERNQYLTEAYFNLAVILLKLNQTQEAKNIINQAKIINLPVSTFEEILTSINFSKKPIKSPNFTKENSSILPNSFYESSQEWIKNNRLDLDLYIPIYPETLVNLTPPKSLDEQIHFSFRFGSKILLPASFITIIPNGRYWLNQKRSSSAVITPDHKIIADLSPEFPALQPGHPEKHPRNHSIFQLTELPPIQKIDETILVLSGLSDNIYFHWLLEVLPQFELLRLSGLALDQVDKILVNNKLSFQQETLQQLNLDPHKIIPITDEAIHLQANKLIVPSLPASLAWMPQWSCDFLRNTFLDPDILNKTEPIERIYISRQNSSNRRIINETEVIDLLTNFGFQTVTLESMSVLEQAAIMNKAKIIVAGHGSGLSNLVFCQPKTKVIEIFSPNYVYHCYWLLSCLLDLDYFYLLGEIPEGELLHKLFYPDERIEDIWVGVDSLFQIIANI